MPLYEYECTACHRRTEKIQKFSDAELTVCPYCGGHLERTITAPAFQFAGGGWYKDGYGSAKAAIGGNDMPSAEAASKEAGKSGGGDSGSGSSGGGNSNSKDSAGSAAPAPAAAPAASSESSKPAAASASKP